MGKYKAQEKTQQNGDSWVLVESDLAMVGMSMSANEIPKIWKCKFKALREKNCLVCHIFVIFVIKSLEN